MLPRPCAVQCLETPPRAGQARHPGTTHTENSETRRVASVESQGTHPEVCGLGSRRTSTRREDDRRRRATASKRRLREPAAKRPGRRDLNILEPFRQTKVFTHWEEEAFVNDPSAGSPTETLLRLLLPLDDQVRHSFRHSGATRSRAGTNPRISLNHPIGSSDGRCVQRAGT